MSRRPWAEAAAADVVERVQQQQPLLAGTHLVCVDGPAGSGKTTLAAAVRRAVPAGLSCRVVHLDDLYPGWDGLAAGVEHVVEHVVGALAAGRPAGYRRWDWHAGRPGPWVEVPVTDWLVLEGVGAGARAYADRTSVLVWVEADRSDRLARGLAREGVATRAQFERWVHDEAAFLDAQGARARADLVVRT